MRLIKANRQRFVDYVRQKTVLAFDMDVSVKYLAGKIRYARMDSFDFADLMEKSSERDSIFDM